ncbi:transcriptional regulator [Opitutaceae bacterium TAV1]|nr:transcriptional regulator [Opitutaceae bacterium TAV1]
MRVNLRTLAAKAGVSLSTASRVLRGMPNVVEEKRQRVLKAAEELGYVRDSLMANAMSYARRSQKNAYREQLGFLSSEIWTHLDNLPWLQPCFDGFFAQAKKRGYWVKCFQINRNAEDQKVLSRKFWWQGIRGVAVTSPPAWAPFTMAIDWSRIAAVTVGRSLAAPLLPRVERESPEELFEVFEKIRDRGYRRIGLALSQADEERRRWNVRGSYLLFCDKNRDVPALAPLAERHPWSPDGLQQWLREEKPDAIVVNEGAAFDWLQAAGVRVPEDVALCRLDCMPGRPETGLAADHRSMGMEAANMLCDALEHGEIGMPATPKIVTLRNLWHEGVTLPDRTAGAAAPSDPPAGHKRKKAAS